MPTDVIMPKLGLTMETGTVVAWRVREGDRVERDQIILDVETDKVVVEVEVSASGVMGPLLVDEGQEVPIGTLLARIYAPGESVEVAPQPPILGKHAAVQAPISPQNWGARGARRFSSPRARKRARALGLDWRSLQGSGPRGRVIERDVLAVATRPPSVPPTRGEEVRWETPTSVQRVVAERMAASFGSAPHFYLNVEVRADALLALHDRLLPVIERRAGVRLTLTDLLVRIIGAALAAHPRANAFWQDGRVGIYERVNVGIAVATDAGLVVPVLRDADRKSVSQIAIERSALVERARASRLAPDDLTGGTFTLTNLGMHRVDSFQAILNPPHSAILAVGRIAERPAVIEGELVACPTTMLTLSCDHRVLDGVLGAQFLGHVAELIEEPYGLLA